MSTCNKCSKYGLNFNRPYSPEQFLEGHPSSRVWIIGLNPKGKTTYHDNKRTQEDLRNYFNDKSGVHEYFSDFKKVSRTIYDLMGKDNGVAHTDLVKCYAPQWPPGKAKNSRDKKIIIENCVGYLKQQLSISSARLLICNGADVWQYIKSFIRVEQDRETYYYGNFEGRSITVVLSGYIGRIDDHAKRRLGKEIEALIEEFGLHDKDG